MELKSRRRDVALFLLITILGSILFGTISGNVIKFFQSWIMNQASKAMWGNLYDLAEWDEDYIWMKWIFGGGMSVLNVICLVGAIAVTAYMFYVLWYAVDDYNNICSREGAEYLRTPNYFIIWLLFWVVPFGIYRIYWFYKYGNQMQELGRKRRVNIADTGKKYLIMLLVPTAIQVVSGLIMFICACVLADEVTGGAIAGIVIFLIIFAVAGFVGTRIMPYVVWGRWLKSLNAITENYTGEPLADGGSGGKIPGTGPWERPPQPRPPVRPNYSDQPSRGKPPVDIQPGDHPTQTVGSVMVLTGQYKNAMIPVKEGEEIILGRDSSRCHLIFENTHVSRVHCGVQYRRRDNVYLITDYSTNGTFLKDGQQLVKNRPTACRRGTIVLLGKSGEQFIVR